MTLRSWFRVLCLCLYLCLVAQVSNADLDQLEGPGARSEVSRIGGLVLVDLYADW